MVLLLGPDLAADVELVTVEGNVLLGDQQDLLAGHVWAMVCSGMSTLVPPENCLGDFLSSDSQPMYFELPKPLVKSLTSTTITLICLGSTIVWLPLLCILNMSASKFLFPPGS